MPSDDRNECIEEMRRSTRMSKIKEKQCTKPPNASDLKRVQRMRGGGGGIRTHGGVSPTPVFKTGTFDRSVTPPTGFSL